MRLTKLDKYDRAVVRQLQDQVEALAVTIAGVECVLPTLKGEVDWFGNEAVGDLRTLVRIALDHFHMQLEAPRVEDAAYDTADVEYNGQAFV